MHGHGTRLQRSIAASATAALLIAAALAASAPAAFATPAVTISSPENGQTVTDAVLTVEGSFSNVTGTASGTITLNGGQPAPVTVTGSSFNAAVDLAAGANSISVTITDNNQNTGSSSSTATVSVTLQTVPVVALGTATVSGTTVSFSGTVSDTSVTQATVIWDGTALKTIAVSGGDFASYVAATDGSHTLAVSATNAAGTGTSTSQSVTVGGSGGSSGGSSGSASSSSSTSSSSSSGAPAASVGPNGGTQATADGTLTMAVPAGAIAAGGTLSATTSTTAPPGAPALPGGAAAASPYVVLSGASLAEPVTATLKYSSAALGGLPPQRLGVFADGAWHYLPTAVNAAAGTVSANVSGPGTIVVLVNAAQLSDVPASYWAATPIATLLGAQAVAGYPDGTFQPGGDVTRAEFAKMLDLTLGVVPGAIAAPTFADVPASAWYAPYVSAAAGAGLMDGVSATSFAPDATMTREQMAVALQRALKLSGGAPLSFGDASSIDGWAEAGVQATVAAGYMKGFPNGDFDPLASTTRAQVAQVLAAVIAHLAP